MRGITKGFVGNSFLTKESVEMNRRSLFKSLFALPIVFLGSKIAFSNENKLNTENLRSLSKVFSPENMRPMIFWKGTNIPISSPLPVTFGCGHLGYIRKGNKPYEIFQTDENDANKIRISWRQPNIYDLKYTMCFKCSMEACPSIYSKNFMCGHDGYVSMKGNAISYYNKTMKNKWVVTYNPIPKFQYVYDCPDCEDIKVEKSLNQKDAL